MICQTIGPMRNFGSSSVPLTGTSRLMAPSTSFSSEVASFIGRVTASFAFGGFAPFELVDANVVLSVELAVLDLVLEFGRERALGDVVAGELAGVRVEDGSEMFSNLSPTSVWRSKAKICTLPAIVTGENSPTSPFRSTVAEEFGSVDRPVNDPFRS